MTWSVDSSCSSTTNGKKSASDSSWSGYYGEGEEIEYPDRKPAPGPCLVAVYNGKVLDINAELICCGLSGISLKHYDGDCLPPHAEESAEEEELVGEGDYYFPYEGEFGESRVMPPEEGGGTRSPSMGSLIKLCYQPKKRGSGYDSDNAAEEASEFLVKPPCVQHRINFRNSFWDLHRPELCKLTWPHVYVGAATVTKHLHKHLLHHGPICAAFHEDQDMKMMLNRELDIYDQLLVIASPREIPPDEKPMTRKGSRKKRKLHPCKPRPKLNTVYDWTDESDLNRFQCLHPSKAEFCITIGRPVRKPPLRVKEPSDTEGGALWLPFYGEYEADYGYPYGESWTRPDAGLYRGEEDMEGSLSDETSCESSTTPSEPGWVEPDYCAML